MNGMTKKTAGKTPDAATPDTAPPDTAARRRWMGVLARAGREELERAWAGLAHKPEYVRLRPPEAGMVMVRGRAGNTGQAFNLGEMTCTRCAVRLSGGAAGGAAVSGGAAGFAWVAGRDRRRAELAAVFDALFQGPDAAGLRAAVLAPLAAVQRRRAEARRRRAEATKVNFFTLVRESGT